MLVMSGALFVGPYLECQESELRRKIVTSKLMDRTVSYLPFSLLVLETDPRIFAPLDWCKQEVTIEACQPKYLFLQDNFLGFCLPEHFHLECWIDLSRFCLLRVIFKLKYANSLRIPPLFLHK